MTLSDSPPAQSSGGLHFETNTPARYELVPSGIERCDIGIRLDDPLRDEPACRNSCCKSQRDQSAAWRSRANGLWNLSRSVARR